MMDGHKTVERLDVFMLSKKVRAKLDELYARPKSEKFTKEELRYLKKYVNTSTWCIHYCLYSKHSPKNKYVGFFIDYMCNNPRNIKPSFYGMNVIASRPLNEKELMWEFQNYGCRNRRFFGWWVQNIAWVQEMDMQYGIKTPEVFVDICNKKGYNHDIQQTL